MGDLEARLIPGTSENLTSPFFSPDGQWIGYFTSPPGQISGGSGSLKKIAVSGGTPVVVCPATFPFGASWAVENTILFGQLAGIMRVSANGGTPNLIIRAGEREQMYGPQLLPDGDSVLFSVTKDSGPNRWGEQAQIVVQSLSSGKRTVVVEGGSDARYLPSGHIVYALRDGISGVAFDPHQLRVTNGAVPLVQGVQRSIGVNAAASNYSVSEEGTLSYVAGTVSLRSLVWINRDGTSGGPIASIPPGTYEEPRLSPMAVACWSHAMAISGFTTWRPVAAVASPGTAPVRWACGTRRAPASLTRPLARAIGKRGSSRPMGADSPNN